MTPEIYRIQPKEEAAILPKPPSDYSQEIQQYVQVAEQQSLTLLQKQALVTYAVYVYGKSIPKLGGQHASKLMSPEDISRILNISKGDVEKHVLLIETNEGIKAWEHFETDIKELNRHLQKQLKQQIRKLYKEGLDKNAIAEEFGVHISTVNRYLRPLISKLKSRGIDY